MTHIASFTFNGFQENTYSIYDKTGECVVVDPGCSNAAEEKELAKFIDENNLTPVRLLNTHCHIDHIMGNAFVAKKYDLPLESHRKEQQILAAGPDLSKAYGLPYQPSPSIDQFLDEGDQVAFGNSILKVFFVPGHSPGHIAFYNEKDSWILSGDVLFKGSIGRYDLPGGNLEVLMESITEKMMSLPNEVKVYSGHGPSTTIGDERKTNPFILQYQSK